MTSLFHTTCSPQEVEIVGQVLRSGSLVMGNHIRSFASEFEIYLGGSGGAVPCASGTDALILALESLDCEGWGVVVPALTFSATYEAVLRAGGIPILCDVNTETGVPSVDQIRDAIVHAVGSGTGVCAVIIVHLYGWPAYELDKIVDFCHGQNMRLIEDCAQATGASFGGHMVGTFGDAAAFSFYPTKPLGGIGDGGAVYFPSREMAKIASARRDHGRTEHGQEFAGYNSRMDEANAAVLRHRLSNYASNVAARRAASGRYHVNGLKKMALDRMGKGVPYVYPIMPDYGTREAIRTRLASHCIESRTHYDPCIGDLPYVAVDCPGARFVAQRVLSLPCHHMLKMEEIDTVCDAVRGGIHGLEGHRGETKDLSPGLA